MTTVNIAARQLCLSKRVKNYWYKSNSPLSLKVWARSSGDSDVQAWLKLKVTPPSKATKVKIVKIPKDKTSDKKKGK